MPRRDSRPANQLQPLTTLVWHACSILSLPCLLLYSAEGGGPSQLNHSSSTEGTVAFPFDLFSAVVEALRVVHFLLSTKVPRYFFKSILYAVSCCARMLVLLSIKLGPNIPYIFIIRVL